MRPLPMISPSTSKPRCPPKQTKRSTRPSTASTCRSWVRCYTAPLKPVPTSLTQWACYAGP
eukprot:2561473-Pleurochrysis_carterae.AAC.1